MVNRRDVITGLAASALMVDRSRAAAPYPAKPITLVVMFASGGPTDQMARAIGDVLTQRLGQPVIVDNRPGGGGQIAASAVMSAPADGYSLLVADMAGLGSNALLYRKFSYDPLRDLEPVAPLLQMPMVLLVPESSPFRTMNDLVTESKKRPLSYASQGVGAAGHLLGDMLKSVSGADISHVPYRGSAPAIIDLMGGQVDLLFDGIGAALPYLNDKKIRAIAAATPHRLPQLPSVPTTSESGFPEVVMSVWFGVAARAGTPAPIVARLNEEIASALKNPNVTKRFTDLGYEFLAMNPQEFAAFMKRDSQQWGGFIKARNISLD